MFSPMFPNLPIASSEEELDRDGLAVILAFQIPMGILGSR